MRLVIMGVWVLVLLATCLETSFSILFPIKKPDGSVDMNSLASHVVLLEQKVETLQQDSRAQVLEITGLKVKIGILQSQLGTSHLTSEVTSLKDELFAAKTELRSVSNEVIAVNNGLKNMESNYTNLQTQMNDTNSAMQQLQVSAESVIHTLNDSIQAQMNRTDAVVVDVASAKYAIQSFQNNLDSVRSSLSSDVANLKNTTSKALKILQLESSGLQVKLNSTYNTFSNEKRLFDKVANELKATAKDTSLLKTDFALMNQRVVDITRDQRTASNTVSAMSSRVDSMNTSLLKVTATSGQTINYVQTLEANLVTVNSTLLQAELVLRAEMNSLVSTVSDEKRELGAALKRFNTTERDTSLLTTKVALINTKLRTMTQSLQTATQRVSGMSSVIDQLKTEVSFEAMGPASTNPGLIKFTDVKHNVGGGYNSTSGQFMAPVSGVYLFWSQIDKPSGSTFDIHLYHNANLVTASRTPVDGDVTGTVLASINLKATDTVHVTATSMIWQGLWSTFGGVLLMRH